VLLSFAALAAIFGAYCVMYLTTPYDLDWQLGTSAGRVIIQLVPGAIFLTVAACRTAEETAIAPAEEPQKAVRVGRKKAKKTQAVKPGR
jgi:hypothetical protein